MKRKLFSRSNFRAFFLSAALFLFFSPTLLRACDFCGAFMGITPFDNQNSFALAHRYRVFNGYEMMNQPSSLFPAGAYRLSTPPSVLHGTTTDSNQPMLKSDFESYKIVELRGRYFIHPRVEINAIVPFVSNKQKVMGEEAQVNGFGDISLFVGWHALQKTEKVKVRQRLIVGAGIKIPTGRSNFLYDDGDRISVMLQAGTGSVDGFAFLTYTAAKDNWRWGATALGKYNGANKYDERVRPSTVNSAFAAYLFRSCSWVILPQVQVYEEYTRGLQNGVALMEGTGMNMVLAGPGVDAYWKKFGISLGAQLPVYQKTDEMNMKTSGRLMVGLSYNFNASHYLFK